VMAEPAAMSWRNPWVRNERRRPRRAHRRRDARRLPLAAVGAGRLQRARALGEHLPRRRRSLELGRRDRCGPDRARPCRPTSSSSARWRARAAATRSAAARRWRSTARCATARRD
jgi:hypothetical protein